MEKVGKIKEAYDVGHPQNAKAFEEMGLVITQAHEFLAQLRQDFM